MAVQVLDGQTPNGARSLVLAERYLRAAADTDAMAILELEQAVTEGANNRELMALLVGRFARIAVAAVHVAAVQISDPDDVTERVGELIDGLIDWQSAGF